MDQLDWVISNDTGVSSKTMWAAINRAHYANADIPCDVSDFGRCYRYYKNCNLTKDDLRKVKQRFVWFAPFIDNWDKLVELYESEIKQKKAPKTYELIRDLVGEVEVLRQLKS